MRWLIATGWGLAVLFGLWRLELLGFLGPSLLRDPYIEFGWMAATPQHPEVVALLTPAGVRVVPFATLEDGSDDARIVGSISLAGEWRPFRPDRSTFVAWRRTSIQVDAVRELTASQAESARSQFLSLQRAWGNAAFVRGLDARPASVAMRPVVRWDIISANLRSVLIPLLLAISVPINVVRSIRWIYQQVTRELERELLDRGLCPKCRYDIAVPPTSICPECGTNLDQARADATRRSESRSQAS